MSDHVTAAQARWADSQVSRHLPYEARTRLVRAAKTPNVSGDPLARARAIDEATADIQRLYPHFFKKDPS